MSLLVDQLNIYLQAQGKGTVGTDLFNFRRPTTPLACVSLRDMGGPKPHDYVPIRYPGVQVTARAATERAAMVKAQQLFSALKDVANLDLGGGFYAYRIHALDEPEPAGEEILDGNTVGYLAGFHLEIMLRG